MRDEFGALLVEGVNSFMDDDHLLMEAESLNNSLEAFKTQLELNGKGIAAAGSEIIAYRDDLRVVVFVAGNDKVVSN